MTTATLTPSISPTTEATVPTVRCPAETLAALRKDCRATSCATYAAWVAGVSGVRLADVACAFTREFEREI
jgi:hypothetical protein